MLVPLQTAQVSFLILCYLAQVDLVKSVPVISNCPSGTVNDGYIKAGTRATCRCTDNDSGFNAYWEQPGGVRSGSGTLSIQTSSSKPSGGEPRYVCKSRNQNNTIIRPGNEYTPKVAYPPTEVSISTSTNNFNLCPSTTSEININCNAEVIPPPGVFSLYYNKTYLISNSFSTSFRPSVGGNLELKCIVKNPKFNDLQTISPSQTIVVREPPVSQPNLRIGGILYTNGRIVTVDEGNSRFTCDVPGGYPQVSSTTLQCGSALKTVGGNSLDFYLNLTRDLNNKNCSCTASHVSGCYNKMSYLFLNVTYVDVFELTLNGQRELEVKPGERVQILCQLSGNPGNSPIIWAPGSTKGLTTSSVTVIANCSHSGDWTCQGAQTMNARLKVICPVQVRATEKDHFIVNVSQHDSYYIEVSAFGYPPRKNYELRAQDVCEPSRLVDIDESAYEVSDNHSPGFYIDFFLGLNIWNFTSRDFTVYKLFVNNTLFVEPVLTITLVGMEDASTNCDDDEAPVGLIVGIVVALVILIVVVIVGVICYRKRRQTSGPDDTPAQEAPRQTNKPSGSSRGENRDETPSQSNSDPKSKAHKEQPRSQPHRYESVHLKSDDSKAVYYPEQQTAIEKANRAPTLPPKAKHKKKLNDSFEDDKVIYDQVPKPAVDATNNNDHPPHHKSSSASKSGYVNVPHMNQENRPTPVVSESSKGANPLSDYDILPFHSRPVFPPKPKVSRVPPVPSEFDTETGTEESRQSLGGIYDNANPK